MKIAIDLDSVLNCLDESWCQWVRDNHDPEWTVEKWVSWDLHKLVAAGVKVYDYLKIPGTFAGLAVRDGAVAATKRLVDDGHELYVASASIPECWPDKCGWLTRHFPHLSPKRFIATESKNILKVDVLIDDGAHNLFAFGGSGIAYDRPWNHGWKGLRMRHWDEIHNLIGKLL